jgi:hypothetical protein
MNRATIYTRTDKGARAAISTSSELSGDLRKILDAIDGSSSVEALQGKFDFLSPASFFEAMATLVADDLIRDAESVQAERKAQELRAKIKARREGADRSPQDGEAHDVEAEEQARRDVAESARQDAEVQARRLAEEKALRQAAERARQEAEAQTKLMAAELARRDAEDKARREAETLARKLADEQALREAAERTRQDAEDKARREAEEVARRDDESARHAAEERARVMAEEKAWREAEEKYRREEAEAAEEKRNRAAAKEAKAGATKPRKLGLAISLGLVALVVIGLVAAHLISYDGQIPGFEKAATAQFQQPVKIKALRLSLLPQVQLRLEGVSIGAEGQIRIPQIKAKGDLGNLFSDKKVFKSIELDSPVIAEAALGWLLFGEPAAADLVVGEVSASNARLESKNLSLPAFDARLKFGGDGSWSSMVVESTDKSLSAELAPKGESVQIEFKARSFKIPFGSDLTLEDMVASGTATPEGLAVTEFKGFAYGGILGGNASLKWGKQWSLSGNLNAKQIDTARVLPGIVDGGRLVGDAAYSMQAPDAAKLFASNHLEGNFLVARGTLLGVDLGRLMQGGGFSGDTRFAEAAGSFVHDRGATQLRQVRLSEGAISANGTVEVDADNTVRGRFAVDLKMSAEQRRANFVISGTLKKIEWRRP